MANPEHFARLRMGVEAWNAWRNRHPDLVADLMGASLPKADLTEIDLTRTNLNGADLSGAILRWSVLKRANLVGAQLKEADLSGAELRWARLTDADLSSAVMNRADLSDAQLSGARLNRAVLWEANLSKARLAGSDMSEAHLNNANLGDCNLTKATLIEAKLVAASLMDADLPNANLFKADLHGANLNGADLVRTNLAEADLTRARLCDADLSEADLRGVRLLEADLTLAKLNRANLKAADLRSATLQRANFDGANLTEARLWETQRADWSIKGVVCECAFWDKEAKVPTHYAPGEFERLYSEQTCIELFYPGGVSTFELNTLPALLHHLASLHPDSGIRLKSIEETGGGARIIISVGDAGSETSERVKADAMQVYQAQLALRDKETERLQIERDYIERLFLGKLIPAMLTAGSPQNVFNAPVTGLVISSGESKIDFQQTVSDNSAILALFEKIMDHRAELGLPAREAAELDTGLKNAAAEFRKKEPDKSALAKSIAFVKEIATEAIKSAAGKLGESAISDWQTWLHQLGQFLAHIK